MEKKGWESLLEDTKFINDIKDIGIFIASHHGRESGYCKEVLDLCNPEVIVFSDSNIMYATQEMSNQYSSHAKGIYFNGASGDLNPITTCSADYEHLDKKFIYDQLGTYRHTKKIGYIIAEEALKLAESIKDNEYFEEIKFFPHLRNLKVPLKDLKYFSNTWFTNKLYYSLKKYLIVPIAEILNEQANFPTFTIRRRRLKIYCHSKSLIV